MEVANTPQEKDEVQGVAATALPNTGGPDGLLLLLGVGLVLGGAGVVLVQRREA